MGCGGSKPETVAQTNTQSNNPVATNNKESVATNDQVKGDGKTKMEEDLKFKKEENAKKEEEQERLRLEKDAADLAFKKSQMLPEPPMFCGHMSRQGQVFRKWQKRFFVLKKGELIYYEGETNPGSQLGDNMIGKPLNLKGYVVTEMEDDELYLNMPGRKATISDNFSTRDKTLSSDKSVARALLVKIDTKEEKDKWEKALNEHINYMNSLL